MTLTVYFSGTGNTAHVAKLFANKMQGKCLSIEDDINFAAEIAAHDTITFCYPIYGSRAPFIMREFAVRHADVLQSKKLVILVTQALFSGDGARVFTDLFPKGHFDVIYADHFIMPSNVCNFRLWPRPTEKSLQKCKERAKSKVNRICADINNGIIKRSGFSWFARLLGSIQGIPWQKDSASPVAINGSMEARAKNRVNVYGNCTACGLCVTACPTKNLEISDSKLLHKNNCTTCYRCINLCPHKAIAVFLRSKPHWQYKGLY